MEGMGGAGLISGQFSRKFHPSKLNIVKTTGKAGGLIRPYKGLIPASATRALKDLAIAPLLPAATLIGWLFYLSLLLLFFCLPSFSGSPVNGSIYSFMLICSHI